MKNNAQNFPSARQRMICLSAVSFLILFSGCISMAPVTTSVESGRLIEKGKVEGALMYSSYSAKTERYHVSFDSNGKFNSQSTTSMETINSNIGARITAGGEKNNFSFHYERMHCAQCDLEVNYFSFEPKFKMAESDNAWSAFSVPTGIYLPEKNSGGETIVQIMPAFHFTYGGSRYFEFSFSPKALFIANSFPSLPLLNVTAGCGLSSDLKQWAIRPEIGYTVSPYGGSGILQMALGLSFNFGK